MSKNKIRLAAPASYSSLLFRAIDEPLGVLPVIPSDDTPFSRRISFELFPFFRSQVHATLTLPLFFSFILLFYLKKDIVRRKKYPDAQLK